MKYRIFLSITAIVIAIALMGGASFAQGKTPIRVLFLPPTIDQDHTFWSEYVAFMQAAAKDLDIELTAIWSRDRFDIVDKATLAMNGERQIDYLVYMYQAKSTINILTKAEQAGVKSFITNTDVVPGERSLAKGPRERFKFWIGHMYPDDKLAGNQLAIDLVETAKKRGMTSLDGSIPVLGIGGSRDSTASTLRGKGLFDALHTEKKSSLAQYVLCSWDKETALKKTRLLLHRYPHVKVYWAASDDISLAIQQAMREKGLQPGRDCLTGGIDWSPQGIEAIRTGQMKASIGGHFMEGAWSLVLLYDYHHGKDFADQGATRKSQMRLITKRNLKTYLPVLKRANWDTINFKRFTKTHNPRLTKYDFSPDAVVRELARH